MTNEELLADLKQFITATVSQATADLATKEEVNHLKNNITSLQADVDNLRGEMNERFDEVMNAEVIKDHERRITRLEHKPA